MCVKINSNLKTKDANLHFKQRYWVNFAINRALTVNCLTVAISELVCFVVIADY